MTTTENVPTFPFDRNHEHCMDRTGINYVPCTSLTHCPSICDCPVGACTAATTCPYCAAAPEHATDHANGEHGTIHPDAIASITNAAHADAEWIAQEEADRRRDQFLR